MADAVRNVILRVKMEGDPANKTIIDRLLASRLKVEEQVTKHHQKETEKQERTNEGLSDRVIRNRIKLLARIADEERKSNEKIARDRIAAERTAAATMERYARQREQMLARYASSVAAAGQEAERYQTAIVVANQHATSWFLHAGEAATRLTRNLTILGMTGSQEMEKISVGLVRVIAGFDVITSSMRLVRAGAMTAQAYGASRSAAAAAASAAGRVPRLPEGASALYMGDPTGSLASGAVSGVAGAGVTRGVGALAGAGGAGGIAMTAGAAIAAIAGVGLAIKAITEIASGAVDEIGIGSSRRGERTFVNRMGGIYANGLDFFARHRLARFATGLASPGLGVTGFLPSNPDILGNRRAAGIQGRADADFQQWMERQDAARERYRNRDQLDEISQRLRFHRYGMSTSDPMMLNRLQSQDLGQQRSAAEAARLRATNAGGLRQDWAAKEHAEKQILSILQQQIGLEEERKRLALEASREKIAGLQTALQLAEQEKAKQQAIVDLVRNQNASAAERFVNMSPGERNLYMQAQAKLAAGQPLTREEANAAAPFRELGDNARRLNDNFERLAGADYLKALELSGQNRRLREAQEAGGQAILDVQRLEESIGTAAKEQGETLGKNIAETIAKFLKEYHEAVDSALKTADQLKSLNDRQRRASGRPLGGHGAL